LSVVLNPARITLAARGVLPPPAPDPPENPDHLFPMANLNDDLKDLLGADAAQKLAARFNLSPEQARDAIGSVGPLVLGGLQKQAREHGGEARLGHILEKHGDEGGLDDMEGYFSRMEQSQAQGAASDPNLGGLLGGNGPQAAQMLERKLGLGAGMGAKLIPMLAPLILGALAKKGKSAGGLGGLASMLDRDGDGQILDDLAGMVTGRMTGGGSGAGAGAGKSGCLGTLLGGLLGGKRRG